MTIQTSVPTNLLRPGTWQEYDLTLAQRGLVPIRWRVALIGCKTTSAPATVLVPMQIFSSADSDAQFGVGSELSLMCRAAFQAAALYGQTPEIWALPVADGTTKNVKTLTVTGPATASGNLTVVVAGRSISVGVTSGDAQNTIATNIQKAVLAIQSNLPVVPTVATNVVTLTAVNGGVNGLDLAVTVPTLVTGVGVTVANSVSGAGAVDITPALDALVDKRYDAVVTANHTTSDLTKLGTALDRSNASDTKKFMIAYVAETGSLSTATTLATTANRMDLCVVSAEDFPSMPGEIAAQYATTINAEDDTARSFNGVELPLPVPAAASVPTIAEVETALAAGASILTVNAVGTRAKVIRAVTTKTTQNGATFLAVLDVSVVRTLFWLMIQIDTRWLIDFPREKKNERTKNRVYSSTLDVLRKAEQIERLQNVEAHKGELVVEDDPVVVTRLNVSIPASVIPPLMQLVGHHVLVLE